jgi:3'(2'), 5'-bisphosphate nucleotidase
MHYTEERKTAVEAVLKACRVCQEVKRGYVASETLEKKDKSPVTIADFSSQAVVSLALLESDPDVPVAAEEGLTDTPESIREKITAQVKALFPEHTDRQILSAIDRCAYGGGPKGRFWTLDPVDGTKGFIRGEQYAIALALIEAGEVVLGVLGCPNLPLGLDRPYGPKGCVFIAVKDQGTWMRLIDDEDEKKVQVRPLAEPAYAAFCESMESDHTSHDESARIAELLGVSAPVLRVDSQCKYGIVARGDACIYLRLPTRPGYEERIWDHAAGSLVVKEAGGEVTDILGKPLDFSAGITLARNLGVVATNGALQGPVLAAIQTARTGSPGSRA